MTRHFDKFRKWRLARFQRNRFGRRVGSTIPERNRATPTTFTRKFRLFFYTMGYLSTYTGFLLLFFFRRPVDFYPLLKQGIVKTHIISVVLWLFTCGMLFSIHVIPQLKARIIPGRRSGLALIVLLIFMSLSGYAIQVMSTAGSIDLTRLIHLMSGIAFTAVFAGHLLLVRPHIRIALASATLISCLVAAPFFFLKMENTFPDEIQLKPTSMDTLGSRGVGSASERGPKDTDVLGSRSTGGASMREPIGMENSGFSEALIKKN